MHKLSISLVATCGLAAAQALAQAAKPGGEPGFFKPSDNPSLTAPRPEPAQPAPQAPAPADPATEIRKAEEVAMDRVEAAHARAIAQARPANPVITSPLDGTAPIMSPLDGTAPIVTPTAR